MKNSIPYFNNEAWHVFAGGTSVPDGYYSYSWNDPNSETVAYIDPVLVHGRVRYVAKFWRLLPHFGYTFIQNNVSLPNRTEAWKALNKAYDEEKNK